MSQEPVYVGDKSWMNDDALKLNIRFVVTAADGRTISFGDDVSMIGLRDWFDRVGRAVTMVFVPGGPIGLVCIDGGNRKIEAIKKVRHYSQIGLREAKDFVEGNLKLIFKNAEAAAAMTNDLKTLDCSVVAAVFEEINGLTVSEPKPLPVVQAK